MRHLFVFSAWLFAAFLAGCNDSPTTATSANTKFPGAATTWRINRYLNLDSKGVVVGTIRLTYTASGALQGVETTDSTGRVQMRQSAIVDPHNRLLGLVRTDSVGTALDSTLLNYDIPDNILTLLVQGPGQTRPKDSYTWAYDNAGQPHEMNATIETGSKATQFRLIYTYVDGKRTRAVLTKVGTLSSSATTKYSYGPGFVAAISRDSTGGFAGASRILIDSIPCAQNLFELGLF